MKRKKNEIAWSVYKFDFQKDDNIPSWEEDEEDKLPMVMHTPFGIFRVDDSMNPFKKFEFWMGNTNFDVTKSIGLVIERIDGVEGFYPISRYSFIIAVGKLFDFKDVRVDIERQLCGKHKVSALLEEIQNEDIAEYVENIHKDVSKHKYWAIYVFPNGSVDYTFDDQKTKDFIDKQTLYEYAQQISNGILITSEDENE